MRKLILAALIGFTFLSCKKEEPTPTPTPPTGDCKCGSIIDVSYPEGMPVQLVVKNYCTGNVTNKTEVGMFYVGWEYCLNYTW